MPSNITRPAQEHFVAPLEETPLVADRHGQGRGQAARTSGPTPGDDVRKRPMFWISSALIVLVVVVALFPGLFTQVPPNNDCQLAEQQRRPDGRPPARLHQAGLRHLLAHHPRHVDVALGRHHRDRARRRARHRLRCLRGLLRRMDRLACSRASATSSSPSPTSSPPSSSCRCSPQYRERVGRSRSPIGIFAWPATARVLRAEILQGEERRLRDGVHGARRLAVPHPACATCCRTRSRRSSSSRRSRSRRRSSPRRPLSFLGVGLPLEHHVVGQRHQPGADRPPHRPQTLIYPSIALSITVLSFIMLGEVIRDALDPKARAQR